MMFRLMCVYFLVEASSFNCLNSNDKISFSNRFQLFNSLEPVKSSLSSPFFNKGQLEFMESDSCILTDENDRMLGSCSKKDSHIF